MRVISNRMTSRLTGFASMAVVAALLGTGTAAAAVPVVMTGSAKEVTRTSMTLCGSVNAEGEATTFAFVYEYYESGWHAVTTPTESAGEGSAAAEECTNVSGLKVATRYGYRIIAKNASGERAGLTMYEETPQAVEGVTTEAATTRRLGATSELTLNGALEPNGYDTHYYFEYRQGTGLPGVGSPEDELLPAPPGLDAGEESRPEHVAVKMEVPTNVVFAYRLVGVNQFGATGGLAMTVIAPAVEGVETLASTGVTASAVVLHGTFEPNGYDTQWQFACSGDGFPGGTFMIPAAMSDAGSASEPVGVEETLTRLSNGDPLEGNTGLSCRLVASNVLGTDEGAEVQLTTLTSAPELERSAAPTVTDASAGVHTNLLTQNEATTYWVEYVAAADYDVGAPDPYEAGNVTDAAEVGASPYVVRDVSRGLGGLAPETTYHYRFVAQNGTGITYGQDETFTTGQLTPPVVATGAASDVSSTVATISGLVNPERLKTSYEFQIGDTSNYGGAEIFGNAGEGGGDESVSTTLRYLVPGLTYHYRLVATNVDGTTYGQDMTFTTPGIVSPISQPTATPLLNVALGVKFPAEKTTFGGGNGRRHKAGKGKSGKTTERVQALKRCARMHGKKRRAACKMRARKRFAKATPTRGRGVTRVARAKRHRRNG